MTCLNLMPKWQVSKMTCCQNAKLAKWHVAAIGMFDQVNGLVVFRNWWLIFLSKIILFLNLVTIPKVFYNSKDSKSALIFSRASVVAELITIF